MVGMKTRVDGIDRGRRRVVERCDAVELANTGLDDLFKGFEHVESERLEGFWEEDHDALGVFSERLVCHRLLSRG